MECLSYFQLSWSWTDKTLGKEANTGGRIMVTLKYFDSLKRVMRVEEVSK